MVIRELRMEFPGHETDLMIRELTGEKNLFLAGEKELDDAQLARFFVWKEARMRGEPLQYLFGHWEFCGYDFLTDKRALIPRPETESLVTLILENLEDGMRVLELGTGTGAILYSLGLRRKVDLTGVDLSEDALALTRENGKRLGVEAKLFRSDLFSEVEGTYDVIVSNPPYLTAAEMEDLQTELTYEPEMALFGGEDGLVFYRRIAREAGDYLVDGGRLYLEVGYAEAQAVAKMLEAFSHTEIYKDDYGIDRMVMAIK